MGKVQIKISVFYPFFSPDLFCLFGLWFNVPVNSYGHVETVS